MERLSPALHASVRRALRQAWELDDAAKAEKLIRNLAQRLERDAPTLAIPLDMAQPSDGSVQFSKMALASLPQSAFSRSQAWGGRSGHTSPVLWGPISSPRSKPEMTPSNCDRSKSSCLMPPPKGPAPPPSS
jgi:hypothetical protein